MQGSHTGKIVALTLLSISAVAILASVGTLSAWVAAGACSCIVIAIIVEQARLRRGGHGAAADTWLRASWATVGVIALLAFYAMSTR
jgi:hypothetical protein